MKIDLLGLKTLVDVSARIGDNSQSVDFYFSDLTKVKDFKESALAINLTVYNSTDMVSVYVGNYDIYQLGERLAIGLENSGLTVQRFITPPPEQRKVRQDLSPTLKIQSFVLA